MSLYPELDDLALAKLTKAFHREPPYGKDYASSYYSEVAWKIRQHGENGNTALWGELERANTFQLRAILSALAAPASAHPQFVPLVGQQQDTFRDLLIKHLGNSDPMIVAEAVDGLGLLPANNFADQILALRNHPSPFVRGSVLRYAAHLLPEQSFTLLIEALNDPEFVVRENAVDELGDLGQLEAIPFLTPLLDDAHPDVRLATQTAIEALTQK